MSDEEIRNAATQWANLIRAPYQDYDENSKNPTVNWEDAYIAAANWMRSQMEIKMWELAREAWEYSVIAYNRRKVHGESYDEQDEFDEWKAKKLEEMKK